MLYSIKAKMQIRLNSLLEEKRITEQKLLSFPDGSLLIFQNSPGYKWYFRFKDPTTGTHIRQYIPKKDRSKAADLAEKSYLQSHLQDLNQEIKATRFYLMHCIDNEKRTDKILEKKGWQELLHPAMKTEAEKWAVEKYERKEIGDDTVKIRTITGDYVRSKSEALIEMALYQHHLPFRYECKWTFGHTVIYPDFTIMDPSTNKLLIWEHFGLIEDDAYLSGMLRKLRLYIRNGFTPASNLIMTFETKDCPLDSTLLESQIRYYFEEGIL